MFIATFQAVLWTTGFDLARAFEQIGAHAVEFNTLRRGRTERGYGRTSASFCSESDRLMVLALVALAHTTASGQNSRISLRHPLTLTAAGLFAVLLTTDLIGLNRGEVIRLWIFLACFFQLPAAYLCATVNNRTAIAIVLGATLLQVSLAVGMIPFIMAT